ncbi:MAG TPA: hypothetical protein VFU59_08160, partial [Candidatus Eisenbacteria bacterium]|nr:hypothetical protein [Candidatus Eisenbacteria bacterium]
MRALVARFLFGIPLLLSLLAAPASAQYIYLDANGDGVNTSTDVLNPVGTTTLEVWLVTNAGRDGTPAVCPTGEELTINTYEFILKATNGQINWLSYTNLQTESTLSFGLASNATEYHNGFGGGPIQPPGIHHLGTLTVSVALGTPSIAFATLTNLSGAWLTSFGSQCPGVDFDNTMKFGWDWFDSDGVAYGGAPQSPPVLAPIADMTADEGQVVQQTITATDPDLQPLLFEKASGPLYVSVATTVPGSGAATGVVTLAPGPADQGVATATVRVTDGFTSDQRSFGITIIDTSPHGPVFYTENPVSIGVGQQRQIGIQVTDPDYDPITLSIAGRPSSVPNVLFGPNEGAGSIASSYVIAPAPGDVGRSFVVLQAGDGHETAYARVDINVTGVALPPPPPADLFAAGY